MPPERVLHVHRDHDAPGPVPPQQRPRLLQAEDEAGAEERVEHRLPELGEAAAGVLMFK